MPRTTHWLLRLNLDSVICFTLFSFAKIPRSCLPCLVSHPHYVTTVSQRTPNQYVSSFGSNQPWITSNKKQRSFFQIITLLMEKFYFLSFLVSEAGKLGKLLPQGYLTTKTQDQVTFPLPNILSSLIHHMGLSNFWHQRNHYSPSRPWIIRKLRKEEVPLCWMCVYSEINMARESILNLID